MKLARFRPLRAVALVLALAACEDPGTSPEGPAALLGSWSIESPESFPVETTVGTRQVRAVTVWSFGEDGQWSHGTTYRSGGQTADVTLQSGTYTVNGGVIELTTRAEAAPNFSPVRWPNTLTAVTVAPRVEQVGYRLRASTLELRFYCPPNALCVGPVTFRRGLP